MDHNIYCAMAVHEAQFIKDHSLLTDNFFLKDFKMNLYFILFYTSS